MQFLANYGLFLAKVITLVTAILILSGGLMAIARKGKMQDKEKLNIKKINKRYEDYSDTLNAEILDAKAYKELIKKQKNDIKIQKKSAATKTKKRIFVLHFEGDIRASAVNHLREEISAILTVASPKDEVLVCLESAGGMVAPYGLAASQLQRIKQQQIRLTIAVDKIAASGGYMMACVADKILAAPFAIIGSIGVIAQIPNFHRLLKKNHVDFEQHMAGEFKRTITMFGEVTDKDRKKFQEDIEEIHYIFKDFIRQNRPQVNIERIATGEHWLATRAKDLALVDELITSDDYLQTNSRDADIYQINFHIKKSLAEKMSGKIQHVLHSTQNYF